MGGLLGGLGIVVGDGVWGFCGFNFVGYFKDFLGVLVLLGGWL